MNVCIIDGIMGAGKTMGMVIITEYFRLKSLCTMYSNFGTTNSLPFTHYRQFLDVASQPSSLIQLDESHTDFDSRSFNTNSVKFFTHLVFYFRKLRTTVFLTTPLIDNLDIRVKGVCNLYMRCTKDRHFFFYDLFDLQSEKFLKRYKIAQESAFRIADGLFNTNEIVTPFELPTERKEFNDFIAELKEVSNAYHLQAKALGAGGGLSPQTVADGLVTNPIASFPFNY